MTQPQGNQGTQANGKKERGLRWMRNVLAGQGVPPELAPSFLTEWRRIRPRLLLQFLLLLLALVALPVAVYFGLKHLLR